MELEEAIKTLQIIVNGSDEPFKFAMETVLEELKNSIPKKKLEDKIKAYEKLIDDIRESEHYSHEIPLYRHDIQVLQELLEVK